jgi:bifunctional non-homologous end joining protein LigD
MSLHDYGRKRRFASTPEPTGDASVRRTHRPIFVVQLHHASSRHYDFRLEMDGVLKSWAVPKGPSLRTGEKRLAVEVEDHPLDYATFEGDIPAGNYGAGHVDVFDHGHWACDGDPLESLAAGKLDFTLSGDRLRGGWKLVRTSMRGKQHQWLLIKRDDAYAGDLEADELVGNSPASRQKPASRKMAAKQKRPSLPRKATSVWHRRALALAGSVDDAMPVDFKPELALLRAAPPTGDDWLHEIKWDGYRLMADLVDGAAHLRSRGGLDWNETFPEVAKAIAALPVRDACLDGELVVLDKHGHSDFSALQRVIDGTSKASLQYRVFDLPGLAGVDLRGASLLTRKTLLKQLLGRRKSLLGLSDHVIGHGAEVFVETGRQGIEGIVSKRCDSCYRAGRSGDWIKVKHEQTDEFVVVGFTAPKGSRTAFGSLLMATREHDHLRYVGRVGTGFDDESLRTIHRRLQAIERKSATVELPDHVPFAARSVHWVKPVLVAEVTFRGWAKEGLLRQASFKRLRSDKQANELEPQRIEENTMQVTHPERLMFADCAYTKGDIAEYYRSVAKWMLPELSDRPLSLMRCPDGSQEECFFQKHHADSLGDAVHAVALKQKSGSEQYLYIDSVGGMLDLVQMSTIEFHPWGAHVDKPEAPDRLVFDLDPGPGVNWPQVIAAARDVRGKLRQAELQSFVRLSGGKGLHVVVPISRGPSWDDVRGFCEAFAQAMAQHAPDTYIATMSKALRKGLVFIDWLRNTRGATSVASWSLRARSGAPVAVPLRWEELGRIKRPDAFDLTRAAQRARRLRTDPWSGFATLRQSLPG